MNTGLKKRMIIYLLIYLAFGIYIFMKQRSMIYFPTDYQAHSLTEEKLSNNGETIRVIVLNPGKKNALVYFGGNAETVVRVAPEFQHSFTNHTIYLMNYRGYGGSTGHPTEQALFSDALLLYDTIVKEHQTISAIGRSLGSGVAVYLAAQRPLRKLILVTPFDSITRIAQWRFPIYPAGLILLDKYDSYSRVKQISAATLILIAEQDSVIKRRHSQRLANAFPPEQLKCVIIKNAEHNDIPNYAEYYPLIQNFLSE